MEIYASQLLKGTLRSALRDEHDLQNTRVSIVQVGQRRANGRYDHEADLQLAVARLQEGPVLLVGRAPAQDYAVFPSWETLGVGQRSDVAFLHLDGTASNKVGPTLRQLLQSNS